MVDIGRFLRLRKQADVIQEGGEWYLTFKRFNPETGEELELERQKISAEELANRKAHLETELAAITAIVAEMG